MADVLDTARKELGVREDPPESNRVKYNDWYYGRAVMGSAYPWCMAFVQWCFAQSGRPLPCKTASCSALLTWYRKNKPECIVKDPRPGDIIIYTFSHTGIVESVSGGTITAIEGNTSAGNDANGGQVQRRTRGLSLVKAYIRPFEEEEPMTGKEIYDALQEYTAKLPLPEWAQAELEEAKRLGITDGENPMQLIPRYQAAIMAKRAVEAR